MPDLRLHESPSQLLGPVSRIGNGEHCVTSAGVVAKETTATLVFTTWWCRTRAGLDRVLTRQNGVGEPSKIFRAKPTVLAIAGYKSGLQLSYYFVLIVLFVV